MAGEKLVVTELNKVVPVSGRGVNVLAQPVVEERAALVGRYVEILQVVMPREISISLDADLQLVGADIERVGDE